MTKEEFSKWQSVFNTTFGKAIAEIDRRCNEITHPIPDDLEEIDRKMDMIARMADMVRMRVRVMRYTEDDEHVDSEILAIERRLKVLKDEEKNEETTQTRADA